MVLLSLRERGVKSCYVENLRLFEIWALMRHSILARFSKRKNFVAFGAVPHFILQPLSKVRRNIGHNWCLVWWSIPFRSILGYAKTLNQGVPCDAEIIGLSIAPINDWFGRWGNSVRCLGQVKTRGHGTWAASIPFPSRWWLFSHLLLEFHRVRRRIHPPR